MKKIVLLAVALFCMNLTMAQDCKKTCLKKDSYVQSGDLIEATLYHDNGMVAQTGFYTLDNKLHGEWVSYDSQGTKTAVANYDNGNKVGTWKFYQGETIKEVNYQDSRIAEVKTWTVTDTKVVVN
ncbi:MAG: hypothetical protein Aureis2KO_26800 [Aureisphaera sp.]